MQTTDRPFSEVPIGEVEMRVVLGGAVTHRPSGHEQKAGRWVTVDITAADVETHGLNGALLRAINEARDKLVEQAVPNGS